MAYTTVDPLISKTLADRLIALGLSQPIAWPNVKFTPPATTYVRVANLLNTPVRIVLANDGPVMQQGIYQVTISGPLDEGELALLEIGGQVAAQFRIGTALGFTGGTVRIYDPPNAVSAKSADGSRWEVIVSISWRSYV